MFPSLLLADAINMIHIAVNSFHLTRKCFLLMEYEKLRRESPKSWEEIFVYINRGTCVFSFGSEYKTELGTKA